MSDWRKQMEAFKLNERQYYLDQIDEHNKECKNALLVEPDDPNSKFITLTCKFCQKIYCKLK